MKKDFFFLVLAMFFITAQGAVIVKTFDAPADGINGLAYNGTALYASTGTTDEVYKLNPQTGAVISSWQKSLSNGMHFAGIGFAGDLLYIGAGESSGMYGFFYQYNQSDQEQGEVNIFC